VKCHDNANLKGKMQKCHDNADLKGKMQKCHDNANLKGKMQKCHDNANLKGKMQKCRMKNFLKSSHVQDQSLGNRKCKYARFFANITGKMQIIKDYQLC
jgi:hypothetical protein